jgi:hypothetical protein
VLYEDCEEIIELVGTEPRRGAVEHYYRASAKTLLPAKAWRRLKKGLRAVIGAGHASDLFNDVAESLKAGKLQGVHDHIARTPLVLDSEGRSNVQAIARRATEEVEAEQAAAAGRMAKATGNGRAHGWTFAVLAFEAAWQPANVHGGAQHVEAAATDADIEAPDVNCARRNGNGTASRKSSRRPAGA